MDNKEFKELIECIDSKRNIKSNKVTIDALCISIGDNEFKHVFTDHGNKLHELRSLSKLVVSICIGIVIDSGKYFIDNERLNLDTRIWSTFKDKINLVNFANADYLKKITIKNLLTQTTGYSNDELLFSASLKNQNFDKLLDVVFNEPINAEPGKLFNYSNASAFILSAFLQELTGVNLSEFAQRVLFRPLNILDYSWVNYGKYCAGATGLYLFYKDVHKLGKLMLHKGVWHNNKIVSLKYINEMLKRHVEINDKKWINHSLSPNAYGLFVWINKNGFYLSGAKGQFIFINPNKKTVITILANQENTSPLINLIKDIL